MKTVIFICMLSSLASTQEYEKGKIDMHGGKYNSLTGYKASSFEATSMNSLLLRDKNTTQAPTKTKKRQESN